ncbi:serine/threonine-protein kinase [Kitasatospora viridis]|uniref:Serine/threonine protein kinase n=1 Tax=Kitasatospora viridis TaxID=281105 RepID=A0A561UBF8_9ACTN|nr:serine/threonine-protein kinase [Kitasatospora viridis]TWF96713.1 serine/threonine protein kinase [Kitasatospora viridis]
MEPLEPDDPRQVGEYRVLRRLGAGGMGRVYLGRTAGGRAVALKVVRSELAEDREFRARFRQEVQAARLVGGEWTAPVLDADTESRHPWVATGYIAGPALGAAVREFGPLPVDSVRVLGVGLAEALAAVHALGLVHRDVKPSNVLLTFDGPRLIDFGIARALDATSSLTRSGLVIGSPGFMSPEQALGREVGPPSDVFSLGTVLAYAATGAQPFGEGLSTAALLFKVAYEEPELTGLDAQLHGIVTACLAKDPAQRPAPAELAARLDASGAGLVRPREGAWLPGALAAAVGRQAEELLNLDHVPGPAGPPPTAPPTAPATGLPGGGPAGQPHLGPPTGVFGAPDNPYGGGHPAPPYAPYPQAHPQPRAQPQAPRRRWPAVLGASVLVAAVAVGTTLWLTSGDGSSTNGQSPPAAQPPATSSAPPRQEPKPSTAAPATPSASAVSGAIPQAYLGSWSGTLSEPGVLGSVSYQVTLHQGQVDQVVATATTLWPNGMTCTGTDYLESASNNQVVLKISALSGGLGCTPDGKPRVYTLNPGGTLHLEVDGGSGTLTRPAPGMPPSTP